MDLHTLALSLSPTGLGCRQTRHNHIIITAMVSQKAMHIFLLNTVSLITRVMPASTALTQNSKKSFRMSTGKWTTPILTKPNTVLQIQFFWIMLMTCLWVLLYLLPVVHLLSVVQDPSPGRRHLILLSPQFRNHLQNLLICFHTPSMTHLHVPLMLSRV